MDIRGYIDMGKFFVNLRSIRSFSRRAGDGVKEVNGYFSQQRVLLIRVHENLVQHPTNNKPIVAKKKLFKLTLKRPSQNDDFNSGVYIFQPS